MPVLHFELAPLAGRITLHFKWSLTCVTPFNSFGNIPRLCYVSMVKWIKDFIDCYPRVDSRVRNRGDTLDGRALSPFWWPLPTHTGPTPGCHAVCVWVMNKWIYSVVVYLLNHWKNLVTSLKMHPPLSLTDYPEPRFAAVRQIEKLVSLILTPILVLTQIYYIYWCGNMPLVYQMKELG